MRRIHHQIVLLFLFSFVLITSKQSFGQPAGAKTTQEAKKNAATRAKQLSAVSLPMLKSDSILQKDVPVRHFDSIINSLRAGKASSGSKFNLAQSLGSALESFLPFQFKYAILLNESVEKLSNLVLYKTIDDWYGTRYRYGGTTSRGIDCSAFTQMLAGYAFGWLLPRTAREQYTSMRGIPRNQLREGDFVFFNTTGGISHVGMYLQNNKFVHSSSSQGVSIGDLNSDYWGKRFIGARRINNGEVHQSSKRFNRE